MISIHAPHARSDQLGADQADLLISFQSTLLMRGATGQRIRSAAQEQISIHAPHARSDALTRRYYASPSYFNPRSSCEERLQHMQGYIKYQADFNPRSSCEERHCHPIHRPQMHHFNPRSSCEERRVKSRNGMLSFCISIHAPHARSDSTIR